MLQPVHLSASSANPPADEARSIPAARANSRAIAVWVWPVLAAAVIRIPIAFVADDQWGDAPIRLDLLERWTAHPGLWWSFKDIFQYGPMPTHLAGIIGLMGIGAHGAARLLVVASGVIGCGLVSVLASRFGGIRAGLTAGFALALSPVHIQASTTFASESIYLAFTLTMVLAALDRRVWLCALLAFCASTTRYDAWLLFPLLAAWWLTRRELPMGRRILAVGLLGLGPASLLLANAIDFGNPLTAINYINEDHVLLVAGAEAIYGRLPWRLAMVGYWPAAFLVVFTPGFAVAALVGVFRTIRQRASGLWPLSFGGVAPAVYAFRSVVMGSLWPMMRFVLAPAALIAAVMPPLRPRTLALCAAIAIACDVGVVIVGDGQPGIGMRAAAISPVSRIPADFRAGGEALRQASGPVALDFVPTYEDILVAYAAGMNRYWLLHPAPSILPVRVVAIAGGDLDAELRATSIAFGHAYRLVGEQGRVSWWDLADEPGQ